MLPSPDKRAFVEPDLDAFQLIIAVLQHIPNGLEVLQP